MTPKTVVLGGIVLAALATTAGFALGRLVPKPVAPMSAAAPIGGKVLYWYDPMVPAQHFDKPGKSPFMDMQLAAKYAGETPGTPGVAIDPARLQNLGVRYDTVKRGDLGEAVIAPGVIDFNQRDVAVVQSRSAGFVQRVYGRAPGDVVAVGAPLADVLVPEWAGAQSEFLAVKQTGNAALLTAARQRLALLGMTPAVIAEVERTGRPHNVTTISTPVGGVIRTLSVRSGMTVAAGQTFAEVNGLGTVWVNASVPAASAGRLRPGQSVQVTLSGDQALPLNGRINAILPEISGDSRTLQVRIELPYPGARLRPGAFATVAFAGATRPALTIPSEAVIRTGRRTLVMLALPNGRFQAAEVQVGVESGNRTEVTAGLTEGEKIVASGQFLIDSEASLSGVQARTAAPVVTAPAAAAVYESRGRIERIDTANVTVSHEPVPAIGWPAMTMTFHLPSPVAGAGLKVGDKVSFAFEQAKDGPAIRRIGKDAAP